MPPRLYAGETVPAGLAWDDVQRLLASTDGESPEDRRDRAALLLAVYGLRAGEVCGLRLDDVDWKAETLRVRRPKPGRTHLYPLSRSVGEALLRCLRDGRPRRSERSIFLTLRAPVEQYIAWRQARGTSFRSGAGILRSYARSVGVDIDCDAVRPGQARAFLAGKGPLTRTRAVKRSALNGFYRYAVGRGLAIQSPLPVDEPGEPASAPPYIYSREDLHRLFAGVEPCRRRAVQLDAPTFRTLLLLLYGAGLRLGEALRLSTAEVDLPRALLTVRRTKFQKTRLVPVGPALARALETYVSQPAALPSPSEGAATFLANRDGTPLKERTVHKAFDALRRQAGVRSPKGARFQPRLHDLRHSFATHRLTSWYRQGADVQRLLPVLATYLGHVNLAGTQVYLSMTPELLREAALRFERYAETGTGGPHA